MDQKLLNSFNSPSSNAEVLYAAAWLVGEFRSFLVDPLATLCALLAPAIQRLPPYVQMVCLHAALKVFSALVSPAADSSDSQAGHDAERFSACLKAAKEGTEAFASSVDLEVQQRASEFRELLAAIEAAVPEPFEVPAIATDLASLFSGDLNPVAPKAQKRVPIPDGLDLEEPFFVPPPPSEEPVQRDESPDEELILIKEKRKSSKKTTKHKRRHTRDEEVAPASSESEDAEAVEQVGVSYFVAPVPN